MKKTIVLALTVMLMTAASAFAADLQVFSDGSGSYPTIQAAVDAANTGDVVIMGPGTYDGAGNYNIDFNGKDITVRSDGGPAVCTIDCGFLGRGFWFHSYETNAAVVEGFTIINGVTSYYGGGIECIDASPTISNCVIDNCQAIYGGAIDCFSGTPVIVDCVMNGNNADFGGAIALYETNASVVNCLIINNSADELGGAIDIYGSTVTISNCTIAGNNGAAPSAVEAAASTVAMTNCIFNGNNDDLEGIMASYSCLADPADIGGENIFVNPMFRNGPGMYGSYYLSQVDAGQLNDSPCINWATAINVPVLSSIAHTTRTDSEPDQGLADLGYHYPNTGAAGTFTLTTAVDGANGSIDPEYPAPGIAVKAYSEILLTATPDAGYRTVSWTEADRLDNVDINVVTMDGDKNVTVKFEFAEFILSTSVNKSLDGLYHGTLTPVDGMKFADGEVITVVATPEAGYGVSLWLGDVIDPAGTELTNTVLMNADKSVSVTFEKLLYLDVRIVGGEGDVVPRRGSYTEGSIAGLEAFPLMPEVYDAALLSYKVKAWTGTDDDASIDEINAVTMIGSNKNVTLEFELRPEISFTVGVVEDVVDQTSRGWLAPPEDDPLTPAVDERASEGDPKLLVGWEGYTITFTATPVDGFAIKAWYFGDDVSTYGQLDLANLPANIIADPDDDSILYVTLLNDNTDVWVEYEYNIRVEDQFADIKGRYGTIQQAIDASIDGQIVVVPDGTYTGDGNVNLDFGNRLITVRSENGPKRTVIDCEGLTRGFRFWLVETNASILDGFTIINGVGFEDPDIGAGGSNGGGILVTGVSRPYINNCIIENCIADGGGAIAFAGLSEEELTATLDGLDALATEAEDLAGEADPADPALDAAALYLRTQSDNAVLATEEGGTKATVNESILRNNIATAGQGGGAVFYNNGIGPIITRTEMTGNTGDFLGGAVSGYGEPVGHFVSCLISHNITNGFGSVYLSESDAVIKLCTIVNNAGADGPVSDDPGAGNPTGGVFSDESSPAISNCIIGMSAGPFDQWGDPFVNGDDLTNCEATFSCIENGDAGDGNINNNPLFLTGVLGDFYLDQADSPGINAGQQNAYTDSMFPWPGQNNDGYGLAANLTTDSVFELQDFGFADMGYHYRPHTDDDLIDVIPAPFNLHVEVVDIFGEVLVEFFDPAIDDFVTVIVVNGSPLDYQFIEPDINGFLVTFTAFPEAGYALRRWYGADNDPAWRELNNSVLVNEDKRVFIEFEEPIKRILLVPSQYQTLEEAFINASPGDEIVLEQGTHYLGTFGDYAVALHDWYFEGEDINPGFNREIYEGLDFSGRALTVRSVDPDDPDVIANTIIDCRGNRYTPRRAFLFNHGEGADSVVTGLTIINGYMVGALGGNGTVNNGPDPFPPNPPITEDGVPNQANSGEDADGDGFGGAILCDNASSPKILNCVITDCTVTGGQGGDGNHGFSVMVGNAQTAGIAGNGTGNGFGGAVACVGASSPTITNCTIKNNRARGACGGIGGNGGSTGNGKAGWGGDSGTGMGDGYGGAVHSDALSLPIFQQVVFANNIASAGFAYSGGAAGIGTANYAAPYNFDAPGGDGMAIGSFDIAGGAVYGGQGSILDYTDCQFIENLAYNSMSDTNPSFETAPRTMFPELIAYTMGGAVFAESTSNVDFDNCDFIDNISGAMRVESDSTVNILDCLFQENATRDLSEFQYSALPDAWPWDPPARNSTVQGGALYIAQDCPQVLVDNTSFMGNETQSNGGAVSLKSNATFTNCQFGGNVAQGTGGAIDMSYSTERTVGDVTTRVYSTLELLTDNCTFTANEADLGGAINAHHLTLTSTGSYFAGNTAWSGGALTLVDSDATITGGTMSNNHATGIIHDHYDVLLEGIGGAAAFVNSSADIQNCIFQNNKADAERSYGGAIAFNGTNDRILHSIKNSLFTGNNATLTGGAVMCSANAKPFIESCTFADNTVNEAGGAVYCDWTANPQISNSIFAGNVKYAVYEEQIGGDSSIVGSLFFDNADGDYFDANTGQAYNGAAGINSVAGNSANVDGDPVFVAGPLGMYYLNQGASAAVNTGVGDASFYGLNIFTTDPVGALDAGVVDIGYHYNDPTTLPQYNLTVSVPGGNGTVEVDTGLYYAGATVTITAIPNSGYRVKTWSGGTVNDSSTALVNAVIMTGDKDIVITFNQPRTIVVGSNNDYTSIQHGIDEAEEGDIVVVAPGHYSSASAAFPLYALQLGGKNITITGSNPDDSGSVAATVLEGVNLELIGLGPDTIIEGLTFTGGDAWTNSGVVLIDSDVTIRNCVFADNRISGGNAITGPGCSVDGGDGGSVTGMLNIIDSSPNISSCIFRDNIILGGDGSDGNTGCTGAPGGDGGWAGRAYGGAVFCSLGSEPVFLDCDFINNSAIGGNAGNGGANGAPNPYGGRGGNYEWSPTQEEYPNWDWWNGWTFGDKYSRSPFPLQANRFDWSLWAKWTGWDRFNNWAEYEEYYGEFVMGGGNAYDRYDDWTRYSGYGGAVYCEFASSAKFIGCSFRGNHTDGGLCGIGGSGPAPPRPVQRYDIPNAGGAVYATKDSDLEFVNCNFTENFADTTLISDDPEAPEFGVPDDIYISFGGAVAYEDGCEVRFQGCEVADNDATLGGGVYSAFSGLEVVDCNSVDNTAYHGAGIYALDTEGVINESQFLRNAAANIAPLTTMYGQGGAFHSVTSKVNVLNSIFRENRASASGGAVYYNGSDNDNAFQNELFNSLFTKNTAGRDGGAVSVNRNTDIVIGNCTISDNSVTGGLGEAGGLGGGLYVSYDSFAKVIDSIIWDNLGVLGSQLAVGSGDEYGARPSTVEMTYTDIGPIVDPNQHIFVDFETDPAPAPLVVPTLVSGEKIYAEYDAGNEKAKIIVTLVEPAGLRDSVDWTSEASKAQFRTEISYIQAPVLSSMSSAEFDLRYRFENLAGFSGSITKVALEKLLTNPAVKHIEPVIYVQPALAQSIPLANATEARMKYDGTGLSVAIVDTGVDYTHPMLGGGGFPNDKVIGGYDFGDGDADPMPNDNAHGTCCAGIAAGDLGNVGDYIGGVAHNANIYALKMMNEDGNMTLDAGLRSWDWCVTHQNDDATAPIMVISNSWGSAMFLQDAAEADAISPAMTLAAESAVAAGMTILAASGNDGSAGQGIGYPAAMSNVISVGAVYDYNDQVTDYSNTDELLDILAPADPMYTTDIVGEGGYDPGDYFPYFNGTSSACPFAAGCVISVQSAAMKELGRYISPMEMRSLLITSGDPVTDTKVNITKPRVNLGMAISSLKPGIPIYVEEGCSLPYWDPNEMVWDPASKNIVDDPNFVGDFFLSQIDALQLIDSPCLDAGSDTATVIGLDGRTTRTDSVFDDGLVNLGYHRLPFELIDYTLTVNVIPDQFILPGFNPVATVVPTGPMYQQYAQVTLTVTMPQEFGFHVVWMGTDNDKYHGSTNIVTMSEDRTVTVRFESIGYDLTVETELDPAMPSGFTPVVELKPAGGTYYPDTVVDVWVTAPPAGFQVRWEGADDGSVVDVNNLVTMTEDKLVKAIYEPVGTKYYSVIVGVNDYNIYSIQGLNYATYDATQFYSKLVIRPEWNAENMYLLLNTSATRTNIEAAIAEIVDKADHDDVFVFYFSGFGTTEDDAYPLDEVDDFDEQLVVYDYQNISDDDLYSWIRKLATDSYAVILDTSFSATVPGNSSFIAKGIGNNVPDVGDGFAADFTKAAGTSHVVLTACTETQTAFESQEFNHGIYTKYLLQAMSGNADWASTTPDNWITGEEMYTYLTPRVVDYVNDVIDLELISEDAEMVPQIFDTDTAADLAILSADDGNADPVTYYVPANFETIQEAVDFAKDGDIIILDAGEYYAQSMYIDKDVTITSTNPDDPSIVAGTIINMNEPGNPAGALNRRPITFARYTGPDAKIDGITIQLGTIQAPQGQNYFGGGIYVGHGASPSIKNCVIRDLFVRAGNGANGQGGVENGRGFDGAWAGGGGIYCAPESSPIIVNTIISNCRVYAGSGGNGANVSNAGAGGRGGWPGTARGGGIYIDEGATPTLTNCTITDCLAVGGNGGNGGNNGDGDTYFTIDGVSIPTGVGGGWSDESFAPWQAWGYIGDYDYYSAYGGGIYCAEDSLPKFIECTIINNSTQSGQSGLGGESGDPQQERTPSVSYDIPTFGGGAYCDQGSAAQFVECMIMGNTAPKPDDTYVLDAYLGHGGGVAFKDTSATVFENCEISGNEAAVGGGMYWADAAPAVTDCNVADNRAYFGGGIYGSRGSADITNTDIVNNFVGYTIGLVDVVDTQGNVTGTVEQVIDTVEFMAKGGGIFSESMDLNIAHSQIMDNEAFASGGGLYFTGNSAGRPSVFNCLIAENISGRDGAGLSVNWLSDPVLTSCTVANNIISKQDVFDHAFGAGIYTAYNSQTDIIYSIVWDNALFNQDGTLFDQTNGRTIAIATGFENDPIPSTVRIKDSSIEGGKTLIFVDDLCTLDWDDSGKQTSNAGIDPQFTSSDDLLGEYYLTQENNQCVDYTDGLEGRSEVFAAELGLHTRTTNPDYEFDSYDSSNLDLGYHYPHTFGLIPDQCWVCDFIKEQPSTGVIDIDDMAILAGQWLDTGCKQIGWCLGADLDFSNMIDIRDFAIFASCWQDADIIAPAPAEWEPDGQPVGVDAGGPAVTMTMASAFDAWTGDWTKSPANYYTDYVLERRDETELVFTPVVTITINDTNPSGEPLVNRLEFTDVGSLTSGREYTYRFKVVDAAGNESPWSTEASALAGVDIQAPENIQWVQLPLGIATGSDTVGMIADEAIDDSPPVSYLFVRIDVDGSLAGSAYGQSSEQEGEYTYSMTPFTPSLPATGQEIRQYFIDNAVGSWSENREFRDTGLVVGETYDYYFLVKDAFGNIAISPVASVIAGVDVEDGTPPDPNPSTWETLPTSYKDTQGYTHHFMRATVAVDAESPEPVEYYFETVSGALSSGWVKFDADNNPTPNVFDIIVPAANTYRWRHQTRSIGRDPQGVIKYNVSQWSEAYGVQ